ERAKSGVARFELQAREAVGDGTRAGAAVALQVHAEQAEVADLLGHLARERVVFEPLRDVRQHAVAHERADGVADQPLVVAEQRVDPEEVGRRGRRRGGVARARSDGRAHAGRFREALRALPALAVSDLVALGRCVIAWREVFAFVPPIPRWLSALDERKPYVEVLDGRKLRPVSPHAVHGIVAIRLGHQIDVWSAGRGTAGTEVRFYFLLPTGRWSSLLPDVSFISDER